MELRRRSHALGRRTSRWLLSALMAFVLVAMGERPAGGQVSPGPLSRAHEGLEGTQNCLTCHAARKGALDAQCLACHREIGRLLDEDHGLHAREGREKCAACHPEHAGRDFELIEWKERPEQFDHRRTGWPLEGKHLAVDCRKCHREELLDPNMRPLLKRTDVNRGWVGLGRTCEGCHQDTHAGRLGRDCARCHTTAGWRSGQVLGFDHSLTRYPLEGRHTSLSCEKCHPTGQPKNVTKPYQTCAGCHADPHAGQATLEGRVVDCSACHDLRGFSPSTLPREQHRTYPLLGRHAKASCADCHRPKQTLLFRPRRESCEGCHADAHAGQLKHRSDGGACASCHVVDGWDVARFTPVAHDSTRFPLKGRHREVACASCHGPQRSGLPPLPGRSELGSALVLLRPIDASCQTCHVDPHAGRFGPKGERAAKEGCLDCHDQSTFRPSAIDLAEHARRGFPLEGSHLAASCDQCHAELKAPRAKRTLLLDPAPALFQIARSDQCQECHRDPHGGQFADRGPKSRCSTCHDLDRFAPASRFDHERDTRFSLRGAHATVACSKCHRPADSYGDERPIAYQGVSGECRACHANGTTGSQP